LQKICWIYAIFNLYSLCKQKSKNYTIMKKEIICWFCCIIVSILGMDALLYLGYDYALLLSLVVCAFSFQFYRKGIYRPVFSSLLCGGISLGSFFLMILSLPLIAGTWYGNVFASSCALICLFFVFFGLTFDGKVECRPIVYDIGGYTEGDYRFPTNDELAEIRERYSDCN